MLQKLDGNAETVGAHLKFRCPLFGETSRASAVVTRVERNTERRRTEPGQAEEHPEPVRPSHLQPAGTPEQMRRIRRPHPPERSAHSWYEFSHENKLLPEHQPPINPGSCRYLFFFFLYYRHVLLPLYKWWFQQASGVCSFSLDLHPLTVARFNIFKVILTH